MASRLENVNICVTVNRSTLFNRGPIRRVNPRVRGEDDRQRNLFAQSIQHSITHRSLWVGADIEQVAKGELASRLLCIAVVHVLCDGPIVLLDDLFVLLNDVWAAFSENDWPERTGDSNESERLK